MDGFGFCSPNFVAVEYFEFVCHELWCGDNINDIVAAVGNVAIDAEIVCFNDGHAKNAAGNGAYPKTVCK